MSTLQVANVNFESTANNQLVYSANTLTVRTGGASIMVANSTAINAVSNTFNLGTSSIAANGYTYLPNGLLMQWGNITATVNLSTTATVTFPTSFTTFYSGSVTLLNNNVQATAPGAVATITANSATTLTWRTNMPQVAASATIYWWAVGV